MGADGEYLLSRLDDLDRLWSRTAGAADSTGEAPGGEWLLEDAAALVLEVAEFIRDRADISGLESQLQGEDELDIPVLTRAVEIFGTARYGLRLSTGNMFDVTPRLQRLRGLPAALSAPSGEPLERLLRLSFLGDDPMDALLTAEEEPATLAGQLEPSVMEKLGYQGDAAVLRLLVTCLGETDSTREAFVPLGDEARESLRSASSAEDARRSIARYLLRDRPKAIRSALQKDAFVAVPMVSVGLARILSWTKNNAQPAPLSAQARLMARQIRRLRHLWSAFLNKSGPDDLAALAKAFALPEDSALLAGSPSYKANLKRRNEPPGNWAALHFVLRSIVTSAELAQRDLPPNVAALWAYKLGLEVMMPHSRSDMLGAGGGKSKGELRLQRELCRFLVERGVHAFGKRFGPAEVDLLAFDPLSALVIETKIAKTPPNEAAFRRWLSQLLSYMDQEPLKNAGALVVYNMGHVPIITRGTRGRALLLKERLYVIPINLCGPTASAREDAIEVLESQEPRDLVVLRAPVRRSSARKSKKRVR